MVAKPPRGGPQGRVLGKPCRESRRGHAPHRPRERRDRRKGAFRRKRLARGGRTIAWLSDTRGKPSPAISQGGRLRARGPASPVEALDMTISIRQLHPLFVGEVEGIDLRRPRGADEV